VTIGIYSPHEDDEKLNFLQELHDLRALCNGPVLIARDYFNLIYQAMNKKNANLNRALMGHFGHYRMMLR
jgi:SNF2 family DNA or RNA helicase